MTQTVAFAIFPFTHKGHNFISKVAETSRFLAQIVNMKEVFIEMNIAAINELMPNLETSSTDEIKASLAYINDGGTEMFLELVGA